MSNRIYILVACIIVVILLAIGFSRPNFSYAGGQEEGASTLSRPVGLRVRPPNSIPDGVPDPATFSENSVAQCWFQPNQEDYGVSCTLTFTFCSDTTSPNCVFLAWFFCRNRLVFFGSHTHTAAGQIRGFFGLPLDLRYADMPAVAIVPTINGEPPPSSGHPPVSAAFINFRARNRVGVCFVGPGPLPKSFSNPYSSEK